MYNAPVYAYDVVPCCASQFTGKERDIETGLDYFGARYYGSNMGRWATPDWSSVPVPVPYAMLTNPQTLNLYSYVRNDPLSRKDPSGHGEIIQSSKLEECLIHDNCMQNDLFARERTGLLQKKNDAQGNPGFWRRLGQRAKNLLKGHGFKTNEQLLPQATVTTSEMYWVKPNFYRGAVAIQPVDYSLTYVPSTDKIYWSQGLAYGDGLALTAGWASNPDGYASGPSAEVCGFYIVGGCGGGSSSGDVAGQVGIGIGGFGASFTYGIDPVSQYIDGVYWSLPGESAVPTFPAGGLQWEDPNLGLGIPY